MKKLIIICFFLLLSGCSSIAFDSDHATFVRVVDGDTFIATIDGTDEYVRLLLVDTPETKRNADEVQPFGEEASKLMENTFSKGDSINLEYGTELRDRYDRILAYAYTKDGDMFNEILLEEGLARVAYVFPPNDKYVDRFREIEAEAEKGKLGVWSINGYVTEFGFDSNAAKVNSEIR